MAGFFIFIIIVIIIIVVVINLNTKHLVYCTNILSIAISSCRRCRLLARRDLRVCDVTVTAVPGTVATITST